MSGSSSTSSATSSAARSPASCASAGDRGTAPIGKTYSNVVGFDDAPFDHRHRGDVPVVGAIFARRRFDGVVIGKVRRDGRNSAPRLAELIAGSRFREHLQLILLQGIALAGFNVVDLHDLHRRSGLPVVVVARREPDLERIREVLLTRVRGGRRKWRLIERAGAMESLGPVWVQRVGISRPATRQLLHRYQINGHVPEPLRVAHLIAGALATGQSRGRA
jgi:endonuclease V-like protein UPF0215 family